MLKYTAMTRPSAPHPESTPPADSSGRGATSVVVGLAGHIDHGKTALVRKLTGQSTERHPEERRRGLTIDLGFAWFDFQGRRFALVDVPGHERFVGNMLAGAAGVDLGLLVVACDDGIMPQTREHAAILELLNIPRVAAALTKTDAVSPERVVEVERTVRAWLQSSSLNCTAVVPTSAMQGRGLDELREALSAAADGLPSRTESAPFRMPIDRVFQAPGHGAVATGVCWSGRVAVGDSLVVLPSARPVRVRRIEVHGEPQAWSSAGRRTALNLAGVKAEELHRGDELVAPDSWRPGREFLVELRLLPDAAPLKSGAVLRLHSATTQQVARVILPCAVMAPGETLAAVLKLKAPCIGAWGRRFLLRQSAPVGTVGGGRFLARLDGLRRRRIKAVNQAPGLGSSDPGERLAAWAALWGEAPAAPAVLETDLGLPPEDIAGALAAVKERGVVALPGAGPGRLLDPQEAAAIRAWLLAQLERAQQPEQGQTGDPSAVWMLESQLLKAGAKLWSERALKYALDELVARGSILRRADRLIPARLAERLPPKQQQLLDRLLRACRGRRQPPTISEFAEQVNSPQGALTAVARVAAERGELIEVSPEVFVDPRSLDELRRVLAAMFTRTASLTAAQIRDGWKITRKHAIPYLEYFDKVQVTIRRDGLRTPGPNLQTPSR